MPKQCLHYEFSTNRELRMVPPGWEHPRDRDGRHLPLFSGDQYAEDLLEYEQAKQDWKDRGRPGALSEWCPKPRKDAYMPAFDPDKATKLMAYLTVSEGTPMSPAFDTPAELAKWLHENGATSFANLASWSEEDWLQMITHAHKSILEQQAEEASYDSAGFAPMP